MARDRHHMIRIGNVRINPDIITAYMPLWTEGHITGIALYIENRTDNIRAAVEHAEAEALLQRLDDIKIHG